MGQQINFGIFPPQARNVDTKSEFDVEEALLETEALQLTGADEIVKVENPLDSWGDLGGSP